MADGLFALAETKKEIMEDIDEYSERENQLNSDIRESETKLSKYSSDISDLEADIVKAEENLSASKKRIEKTQEELSFRRQLMMERIKFTYENPTRTLGELFLLSAMTLEQYNSTKVYAAAVSRYDKEQLTEYEELLLEIKEQEQEYKYEKEALEGKKASLESKKSGLLDEIKKKEEEAESVKEKRQQREQDLKELMEEMKRKEAALLAAKKELSADEKNAASYESEGSFGKPVSPLGGEEALLAALIYCEAGSEPYEGQLAVASVVLNRVNSGHFPNNITDVIYAPSQFTPAASGRLALALDNSLATEACQNAARAAISGNINGNWLYFRVNDGSRQGTVIGRQVFY